MTGVTGVTRGDGTEGGEEGKGEGEGGGGVKILAHGTGRTDGPTEGSTRGPREPKNYTLILYLLRSL